jgi:squalene-hopene/tetraprenyl-beta-curcumene cyclase
MDLQVDLERMLLAHKAVRAELLAERTPSGHWGGHVASSPFATAAAISALVTAHHPNTEIALRDSAAADGQVIEHLVQGDLSEFLVDSVHWLARHQNPDGGWGDCDAARSNIAATMLVQAAFRLTGIPAKYADLMLHADQYVAAQGGVAALRRRYGRDKTLVAPILANCALAGMVPWRQVPTLPFELVCLPKRWQQHLQMPVVRPATPILLAVGRAKFHHDPPRNPLMRLLRRSMRANCVSMLEQLQAADDSFLASTPMTAFVVMSLASIGYQEHPIVQRGVEFLLSAVRCDASWPIVTSLATSVTSLALNNLTVGRASATWPIRLSTHHASAALAMQDEPRMERATWEETAAAGDTVTDDLVGGERPQSHPSNSDEELINGEQPFNESNLDWLLECQRKEPSPLTDVPAGGWAWSDMPGALPNSKDTAAALVALARWPQPDEQFHRERIERSARLGVAWLLEIQGEDGGWPTFYHDSGSLRFDESGVDVTAHALRALAAWRGQWQTEGQENLLKSPAPFWERIGAALDRGWQYLESQQRGDGSYEPLWFGNEHQPGDHNPVVGTAEVLITCAELERLDLDMAQRAARWLLSAQHVGGGWGPPRAPVDYSSAEKDGFRAWRANEGMAKFCSVEETALAVTALLPLAETSQPFSKAVSSGLTWLANAVEQDAHRRPAVIGVFPSKIWYHERLYPLVFATGALSRAAHLMMAQRPAAAPVG